MEQLDPFAEAWTLDRLGKAVAAGAGLADGVEAAFEGERTQLMRLAESAVVQASDLERGSVIVRAVVDGREGRCATTDLSDAGLADCTKAAIARAAAAPPTEEPFTLPAPARDIAPPTWGMDEAIVALTAREKADWFAQAFVAHEGDGLALAGRFHTGVVTRAVRSTTGVSAYHQGSAVDLALSALERPAGHGASAWRGRRDATIERAAIDTMLSEVHAECGRAKDPVAIDAGAWDCVLSPAAVAELLEWLSNIAFSSRAWDDGMSFLCDRIGDPVTGEAISIYDDGSMPHGVGIPTPFDIEGQTKRRVTLVEAGVARGIVHDVRSARRASCATTGHAHVNLLFPQSGSNALHLHVAPGEASVDDLIDQVGRGLYISRFHYVNGMIEPKRAVMTGLLRDGNFLIEDGRLTRAVQPMRFTDSILEAFARVPGRAGVGRDLEPHGVMLDQTSVTVCPHLLVRGLQFTSGRV